jgi:hypothetical protein
VNGVPAISEHGRGQLGNAAQIAAKLDVSAATLSSDG